VAPTPAQRPGDAEHEGPAPEEHRVGGGEEHAVEVVVAGAHGQDGRLGEARPQDRLPEQRERVERPESHAGRLHEGQAGEVVGRGRGDAGEQAGAQALGQTHTVAGSAEAMAQATHYTGRDVIVGFIPLF
jgi:hypothetical protein